MEMLNNDHAMSSEILILTDLHMNCMK